ncbi:MAG: transcriptional regulator, partial [Bacteroidetes bacterium]
AELSGMTRDSVVRVLRNFTSENLIDIQDKGIVILNKEKLEELSRLG